MDQSDSFNPTELIHAMSAIVLSIVVGWSSVHAAQPSATPPAPHLLSDGVYTDAQAKRGEALYGQYCARCHNPDLLGNPDVPSVSAAARAVGVPSGSPPPRGGEFVSKWTGMTLNNLFQRIRSSMPQETPGALSRQMNADILSFILAANMYPAGMQELPGVDAPLDEIRIAPIAAPIALILEQRTAVPRGALALVTLPEDPRYVGLPGNTGGLSFVRREGRRLWYRAVRPGPDVLVIGPQTKPGECISCDTLRYFVDVVPRP